MIFFKIEGDKLIVAVCCQIDFITRNTRISCIVKDKDIFANCHQATINHIDNTIDLKKQVVVIQEDDRLEADHFIFNRVTGERIGEGNVKFRVRIRSTTPSEVSVTNGTNNDNDSRTGE